MFGQYPQSVWRVLSACFGESPLLRGIFAACYRDILSLFPEVIAAGFEGEAHQISLVFSGLHEAVFLVST